MNNIATISKKSISFVLPLLTLFFIQLVSLAQQNPDVKKAKQYFHELDSLCALDDGKLWGVNLYGPTMLIIPENRFIIANQPDTKGALRESDGVYVGTLPAEFNVAKTSFSWNGKEWTMVAMERLSENDFLSRAKLLIHESWHRIQKKLGIASVTMSPSHLEPVDGIIMIRLELRALLEALTTNDTVQAMALRNALIFRAYSRALYPENHEDAFERHEGLAEYTGYKLCGINRQKLPFVLSEQLQFAEKNHWLTDSFTYLTGTTYGIFLDSLLPEWRNEVITGATLPTLIERSLKLDLPTDISKLRLLVEGSTPAYHGDELIADKFERYEQQKILERNYKARFIDGNKLMIMNDKIIFCHKPKEDEFPLGCGGVVYKTLTLTADWGTLEVSNGILWSNDCLCFIVAAPHNVDSNIISENDYTLTLNKGWKVVKGKDNNYTIEKQ